MPTLAGKGITQNGLGLMRLAMPQFKLSDEETLEVLRAALDADINVWNASDYYGTPEETILHILNRYFSRYPEDAEKVILSIKTGIVNRATMEMDCSAAGLRKFADKAISILDGKKKIDIFGIGRIDPKVPVEESVRALLELKDEGKFNGIQLSEVRADTIRRAASVGKIDMVESEANLWSPMVFENGVAEACAELGIVLEAHSPLGMGALAGKIKGLPQDSPMAIVPRYHPDVLPQNLKIVEAVSKIAEAKGCSTAQLALSWLKCQSKRPGMPVVVPISGARSVEKVRENAVTVELSTEDYEHIAKLQQENPVEALRTIAMVAQLNEY